MRLGRLIGLERDKLEAEFKELWQLTDYLEDVPEDTTDDNGDDEAETDDEEDEPEA